MVFNPSTSRPFLVVWAANVPPALLVTPHPCLAPFSACPLPWIRWKTSYDPQNWSLLIALVKLPTVPLPPFPDLPSRHIRLCWQFPQMATFLFAHIYLPRELVFSLKSQLSGSHWHCYPFFTDWTLSPLQCLNSYKSVYVGSQPQEFLSEIWNYSPNTEGKEGPEKRQTTPDR